MDIVSLTKLNGKSVRCSATGHTWAGLYSNKDEYHINLLDTSVEMK